MEAATPPPPPAPPPHLAPAAKRVDVGRVLSESFRIYGEQAGPLLGSAAVVFIVAGVAQAGLAATESSGLVLLGSIISLAATTLYTGFVVKLVEDVRDGRRDTSVGDMFRAAAGVILPLIGNGILKWIAVVIGLILLIVPGLILLTIWAVTAPAIVVERKGPIGAFGRSRELVKGEGWRVFGVILVAFLIYLGISIVATAIGAATGDAGQGILSVIGSIVTAPILALVAAVLFFDLGGGRGEADPAAYTPPPAEAPPPPPPPAPAA